MVKACGTLTVEHRRKVGEGVARSWQRRTKGNFKTPKGKLNQIARILGVHGSTVLDVVDAVRMLEENYRRVCSNLQECAQRHKLGSGGEQVDKVVVAEIERLKAGEPK